MSSLKLREPSGQEIPVRDTSEPISVFLDTDSEFLGRSLLRGHLTSERSKALYQIAREARSSLYLEVNCTGLGREGDAFKLLWRKDHRPSAKQVDFLWELNSCNDTLTRLLTGAELGNADNLFLEVQFVQRNASVNGSSSGKLEFKVSMNGVSCHYYDEQRNEWSTGGCEVMFL